VVLILLLSFSGYSGRWLMDVSGVEWIKLMKGHDAKCTGST